MPIEQTTRSDSALQGAEILALIANLSEREVHTGYDHGGNYIYEDYVSLADVRAIVRRVTGAA